MACMPRSPASSGVVDFGGHQLDAHYVFVLTKVGVRARDFYDIIIVCRAQLWEVFLELWPSNEI